MKLAPCWHECLNPNCRKEFVHHVNEVEPLDNFYILCLDCAIKESQTISTGKVHEAIHARRIETPEGEQCQGWTYGWGEIEAPEPSDLFTDGDTRLALAVALESGQDFAELEL